MLLRHCCWCGRGLINKQQQLKLCSKQDSCKPVCTNRNAKIETSCIRRYAGKIINIKTSQNISRITFIVLIFCLYCKQNVHETRENLLKPWLCFSEMAHYPHKICRQNEQGNRLFNTEVQTAIVAAYTISSVCPNLHTFMSFFAPL